MNKVMPDCLLTNTLNRFGSALFIINIKYKYSLILHKLNKRKIIKFREMNY